jgi:hypothetical protein
MPSPSRLLAKVLNLAPVALAALPLHAADIVYPPDAGVIDVTAPPYSAVPDDGLDDTAAIQAALDAYPNGNRIIYLRDGVYQISDTLSWPAGIPGQSDYKRTILEGRSRSGAVLRLADRTAAFGDPANARPVVYTGPSAPAQRFRNAVRNLTIHTGTGNPGAIGLHFASSNQGVVRDVTIRSGDGAGVVGLDLRGNENGPLLVRGLVVEGFAKGVSMTPASTAS